MKGEVLNEIRSVIKLGNLIKKGLIKSLGKHSRRVAEEFFSEVKCSCNVTKIY